MSDIALNALVGRNFEISVYSYAGTGYSWCLAGLSGPAFLMGMDTQAVKPGLPGGAVRETFTFIGAAAGDAKVTLELVQPWDPQKPADKRTYTIHVANSVDEKMRAAAGSENFPSAVFGTCDDNGGGAALESKAQCNLKYGVLPHGGNNCVVKYGFPIVPLYNVSPPTGGDGTGIICFYMAQPPRS
jgi:hypothetical protein